MVEELPPIWVMIVAKIGFWWLMLGVVWPLLKLTLRYRAPDKDETG